MSYVLQGPKQVLILLKAATLLEEQPLPILQYLVSVHMACLGLRAMNQIMDEGACSLVEALGPNTSLKRLSLRSTGLKPQVSLPGDCGQLSRMPSISLA